MACSGGNGLLIDTFKGDIVMYVKGRTTSSIHVYVNELGIVEKDYEHISKMIRNDDLLDKLYKLWVGNEIAQYSYAHIQKVGYYLNLFP